ncbi:MAG: UDP-N-acetylglucosamine 2-epimerase (non-hydrolyzing) [Thermodesulfobacteriota bacterium]|nr:UDP-N-acetylglucosamine 2-epimerase (non-hydrolyzing) [Thermodesulfobacteriota bacterium]
MKIHLIAAARPNFMKIAPLFHELKSREWAEPVIVHTGQHYDLNMSDIFFKNFKLPEPHVHLGVGSGSHAEQTGNVMIAYEKVLMEQRPDLVVVVGDVNSTVAASLAAVKLGIRVAHLEAGLRSFDRTMPEEINRIVTDSIVDFLWTPSADGNKNLEKEGIDPEKIILVGNIMIDSLVMAKNAIEQLELYSGFGCKQGEYGLVTLHRPSNVDDREVLKNLCEKLAGISNRVPLIFPVHPRTLGKLKEFGIDLLEKEKNIHLTAPLGYNDFMNLVFNSRLIITDSGGVQEETTFLKIPCLTLRANTERPVTVTKGTNQLCTSDNLDVMVDSILGGSFKKSSVPELWDGKTAGRIADVIFDCIHL